MKASDLPANQLFEPRPRHLLLWCKSCGYEYSAYKADYSHMDPGEELTCCDQLLVLAVKRTVITEVEPE